MADFPVRSQIHYVSFHFSINRTRTKTNFDFNTTLLDIFLDGNTLVVSSIYLGARQLVAAATDLMTV